MLNNLEVEHTLLSIAEAMQMSARNLSRIFKQETGLTLMNFVNDARIDAARRYLEATDLGLSDIARRCGLTNAATLRRIFSKRLGISPADYRQRFHSEEPVQRS